MSLQTARKSEYSLEKVQSLHKEIDYENYLRSKTSITYQRKLINFKGHKIILTQKQVDILKLVAKGFSNARISREMKKRESAIKLSIYRTMKYLEIILDETIDRFYLIIIAQELDL